MADSRPASFEAATRHYRRWLAAYCTLDRRGWREKKRRMAKSPFALLRGTFYRWPAAFAAVDTAVRNAPVILCVGDIHLENFGTWRDSEGRLVWGINDFDEAARLPFTSDLVRLATSAALEAREAARQPEDERGFRTSEAEAVEAILDGYQRRLKEDPEPFVLEDRHAWLRDEAAAFGKDAKREWAKLRAERQVEPERVDGQARDLLLKCLPHGSYDVRFYERIGGLGSLGRPRYVAIGEWFGGLVAREAKAAVPSAMHQPRTDLDDPLADYRRIEAAGYRARDPFLTLSVTGWVVRRLSPETRKLELDDVEHAADQTKLLRAMGEELANVHLGTARGAERLRRALKALPKAWLAQAVAAAAERVEADYAAFTAAPEPDGEAAD